MSEPDEPEKPKHPTVKVQLEMDDNTWKVVKIIIVIIVIAIALFALSKIPADNNNYAPDCTETGAC